MRKDAQTCSRQPHDSRTTATNVLAHALRKQAIMEGAFIMRYVKRITFVFALALFVLASRTARADEFDRFMVLTFSSPVEVPGTVLPEGTYEFKLADPNGDRNVLEIRSGDGSKVYATLLTIPTERTTPTDEPVVTFEERAGGAPEAIRTVFYPGETTGMEFQYPTDSK
jgi:hypothetical protein